MRGALLPTVLIEYSLTVLSGRSDDSAAILCNAQCVCPLMSQWLRRQHFAVTLRCMFPLCGFGNILVPWREGVGIKTVRQLSCNASHTVTLFAFQPMVPLGARFVHLVWIAVASSIFFVMQLSGACADQERHCTALPQLARPSTTHCWPQAEAPAADAVKRVDKPHRNCLMYLCASAPVLLLCLSGEASEEEVKERQARGMADPEVQNILMDPVMRQVLDDFQSDPRAARHHLQNADIHRKISKLVSAGIIQLR